jgi:diguanylate cyclase (GGDEF)-like protein
MIFSPRFAEEKEQAYQADRAAQMNGVQRWLILVGGTVYCLASLWVSVDGGSPAALIGDTALVLLTFTFVLFGSSYLTFVQDRGELLPILFALAYAVHIAIGASVIPSDSGLRFALLAGLLLIYLSALSPTLLIALAAMATAIVILVIAMVFLLPMNGDMVSMMTAFGYMPPSAAVAIAIAYLSDKTAREAFTYKWELSRRATTDELSGVANKSHIRVLANNEFSRARRYREPFSCLMFEIDGLDFIRDTWGDHAADTIARVFAGYCVLVMRHCDSLGRLSERRFIALLPETPGAGALVLAKRMVSDLRALDVSVYGEKINFTVSIGVAEMNKVDETGNDLLKRSERGLEDAIEQGREQAVMATAPPRFGTEPKSDTAAAPQAE